MYPSLQSQLSSLKFKKVVDEHLHTDTYKGLLGTWNEELFPETIFALVAHIEGNAFFEDNTHELAFGYENYFTIAGFKLNGGEVNNTIVLPIISIGYAGVKDNEKEVLCYLASGMVTTKPLFPLSLYSVPSSKGAKVDLNLSIFAFYI